MRAWSKTCLATVLIRSILRWKNCTRAVALVQFFPRENRTNQHSSKTCFTTYLPMMTPSTGDFSAFLAICTENAPVTGEFPSQRASDMDLDVSLMLVLINCYTNNQKPVIWHYMAFMWRHRDAIFLGKSSRFHNWLWYNLIHHPRTKWMYFKTREVCSS